ncbi:MAG: NAD(P)/FAD-dependent oxidoreductase [Faecalibacterium sp.]|nr:NAD(P)/FAD-dependent oxidoreductase [Ruminococcus sp.]MCM1391760.1 NAD(P)/FAD-dependent oxidoreductase [Ruminococcus sp.]MCM1485040.1 NAD(P)/FAD-dependent oxidoreductase [Faecalibacterium sp.]
MSKRIIVAGGGHGGISAAAILAKRGFDVTVIERNSRENMGYDWTDIFDKNGFICAEMELPEKEKFKLKHDMTFFGPSFSIPLRQDTPIDQLEIQMERKDIYAHIIAHAERNGVKFVFETTVNSPIFLGNRVVGVETDKGVEYADLIIDAAGINSPLRSKMPISSGIQQNIGEYEQFYVYRGFFNRTAEVDQDKFKVMLLHQNKLGICWVAAEEEYTDVLIGRFEPFDMDEVIRTLNILRETESCLGTELVRGGQFVNIPVRQPLAVLVADGYAAIGDSAFMTVPIIGSGIANSLKAGRILADAVVADKDECFSAETLWKYQRDFYNEIGAGLAPLACVKLMLTRLEGSELDYIFENGILNAEDMTIGADSTSLTAMLGGMKIDDIKIKLKGLFGNKNVLSKVIRMGKEVIKATIVTNALPKEYNKVKVLKWAKQYNACFKH